MGELWERSQNTPYEKVGNYKYLQVFIQVPSTVHWWNMVWMQQGEKEKTSDVNVTSFIPLVQILIRFISLGQHQHWAKTYMSDMQMTGFFFKIISCWTKNIIRSSYFWVIRNTGSGLSSQRWVDIRLFREMVSATLPLSFCKQLTCSLCSPPTTTSFHH